MVFIMQKFIDEYGKVKKEYEKYKDLRKEIGLKESKLIDVKQMEENLTKIHRLYKNEP